VLRLVRVQRLELLQHPQVCHVLLHRSQWVPHVLAHHAVLLLHGHGEAAVQWMLLWEHLPTDLALCRRVLLLHEVLLVLWGV